MALERHLAQTPSTRALRKVHGAVTAERAHERSGGGWPRVKAHFLIQQGALAHLRPGPWWCRCAGRDRSAHASSAQRRLAPAEVRKSYGHASRCDCLVRCGRAPQVYQGVCAWQRSVGKLLRPRVTVGSASVDHTCDEAFCCSSNRQSPPRQVQRQPGNIQGGHLSTGWASRSIPEAAALVHS